jgi:hypothetical protein
MHLRSRAGPGSLYNLGRYAEALSACEGAISVNPLDEDAWYNMGIVLKALGRYTESDMAFIKAREIRVVKLSKNRMRG